jgi:alkylation response protein AidB-like acyl-CoA dehydrogenase
MDLTPNDEQVAFLTATADWCSEAMPIDSARTRPTDLWQQMQAMGLTGIAAPEAHGGMGLDFATEALVFAELGRHLAPLGLLSTAVGNRWFEDGFNYKLALALPGDRDTDLRVLDPAGSGGVLMATPNEVRVFDIPDQFTNLVTREKHVTPHQPTIDPTTDQSRQAWTTTAVFTDDRRAALHLQLLAAAYAVGCADLARDMATDYAKVREQFERPIGWFQAIKHICADMAVRCAGARSQLYYAACALDAGTGEAAYHVAAAKRLADTAALDNGRANIQVHGGIGMTDEAYPHLTLKRAHLLGFIAPVSSADLLSPELEPA